MRDAIRVSLQDAKTGKVYHWTVRRIPRAINCTVGETRIISGWQYADHDGYERFAEGNWLDLVAALRATADNYGLTTKIS